MTRHPVQGPSVRWRSGGHELKEDTDVLRFEVSDLNRVITRAAANAELYRAIQDSQGHPADWQVLPLSCFAVTDQWTPARLSEGTGFAEYRLARAAALIAAGFALWPTEVFNDGVPDPRNEVHYDLIVAAGPSLIPPTLSGGTPSERRAARAALAPYFSTVLEALGEPQSITHD